MQLQLWKFAKKEKSTIFPTTNPLYEYNVVLKDGCSLLRPSWVIKANPAGLWDCNYALWNKRYYKILDMVSLSNGHTQINAEVDVLATYQEYIYNYHSYVLRCGDINGKSPYAVYDDYFIQTGSIYQSWNFVSIPNYDSTGTLVVRCLGTNQSAISTYAMTYSQFSALMDWTFTGNNYSFLSDDSIKSFFNPFQYIVSVKWFPFDADVFGLNNSTVKLGWWDTGCTARLLVNTDNNVRMTVALDFGTVTDFRRYSPSWTSVTLYLPGIGKVPISPSEIYGNSLDIEMLSDFYSGMVTYLVYNDFGSGRNGLLATYTGMIGVDVQIGQLQQNALQMITSTLNAAGSLVSGNVIGTASNTLNVVQEALTPTPSILGSLGSTALLTYMRRIRSDVIIKSGQAPPYNLVGYPSYSNSKLGNLTGYIKCLNANVLIPGLKEEQEAVNNFLNTGFYMESP